MIGHARLAAILRSRRDAVDFLLAGGHAAAGSVSEMQIVTKSAGNQTLSAADCAPGTFNVIFGATAGGGAVYTLPSHLKGQNCLIVNTENALSDNISVTTPAPGNHALTGNARSVQAGNHILCVDDGTFWYVTALPSVNGGNGGQT